MYPFRTTGAAAAAAATAAEAAANAAVAVPAGMLLLEDTGAARAVPVGVCRRYVGGGCEASTIHSCCSQCHAARRRSA